jgi:hypothetical protein
MLLEFVMIPFIAPWSQHLFQSLPYFTPTTETNEVIRRKRQRRRPMQTSRDLSDGSVLWKRSFRLVDGGGFHFDRTLERRLGNLLFVGPFCVCVCMSCRGNSYSNPFFVRSYRSKCFHRSSAGLPNKFCVSRSCDYCNNLFSKLTTFIIFSS